MFFPAVLMRLGILSQWLISAFLTLYAEKYKDLSASASLPKVR